MGKIVDENGFWLIKDNPISKAGVYPYLGRTVASILDPDKMYNVLRPEKELGAPETVSSFDGVPFTDEHEMIGEGFTPYDQRPAGGILMNPTFKNGVIYGDLKIFSEDLKNKIISGKKQLSIGYVCDYQVKKGEYNGQPYDAVQCNIRGNHLALVDRGRMGKDVRVYDHVDQKITFDSMDFDKSVMDEQTKGEENMAEKEESRKAEDARVDKRKLIDEIGGMAKSFGANEEQIRTIIKKAEAIAYNDSSRGTANDESDKKNNEEKKKEEPPMRKAEDAAPVRSTPATATMDKDEMYREFKQRFERERSLVENLTKHIGTFACDGMTPEEIALYGCQKLGLDAANGHDAEVALRTYFAVSKKSPTYALDESPQKPWWAEDEAPIDDCLRDYLDGK